MSSSPTTTELAAVAAALRQHERFLVTTHENPDGDALGSLLAMHLALEQLGKDAVMYLAGAIPMPQEYAFMRLEEKLRLGARPGRRRLCEREPTGTGSRDPDECPPRAEHRPPP
jgi:hypothetical protein